MGRPPEEAEVRLLSEADCESIMALHVALTWVPPKYKKLAEIELAKLQDSLLAQARVIEAADRVANWNEPRIIPTEECPDQATAMRLLRAALAAGGRSRSR